MILSASKYFLLVDNLSIELECYVEKTNKLMRIITFQEGFLQKNEFLVNNTDRLNKFIEVFEKFLSTLYQELIEFSKIYHVKKILSDEKINPIFVIKQLVCLNSFLLEQLTELKVSKLQRKIINLEKYSLIVKEYSFIDNYLLILDKITQPFDINQKKYLN